MACDALADANKGTWSQDGVLSPMADSIVEAVAVQAQRAPERTAIIFDEQIE